MPTYSIIMTAYHRIWLITTFVLAMASAYGQDQHKVDSLKIVLQKNITPTIRADVYNELSVVYSRIDFDQTVEYASRAIKESTAAGYEDGIAMANSTLGTLHRGHGDYDAARKNFITVLQHSNGSNKLSQKLNAYRGLSGVSWFTNDFDQALFYTEKSLVVAEQLKSDREIARALSNMGLIYWEIDDYHYALKYSLDARRKKEMLGENAGLAALYTNIGMIYKEIRNYEQAEHFTKLSLALCKKQENWREVAKNTNNLATIYHDQKNFRKSILYYRKALDLHTAAEDTTSMVQTMLGLADQYLDTAMADSALIFLDRIAELIPDIDDQEVIASYAFSKSFYHYVKGEYQASEKLCQEANVIFAEINELRKYANSMRHLADIKEKIHDYQSAFSIYKVYKKLDDSLYSSEKQRKIARLEADYHHHQEKDSLKYSLIAKSAELKSQGVVQLFSYIGIGLTLSLIVVLSVFFISKQSDLKRISLAHSSLEENIKVIEAQNKNISDSIQYAQRIQQAILPIKSEMATILPEHFVFLKPRNVVSGDFYWVGDLRESCGKVVVAVIDCTGHGVPGAFMSMIGNDMLNYIVREKEISSPDQILNLLHKEVRKALHQSETGNRDGMEISIAAFNEETNILEFAGARNSLIYIQNGELNELKGNRMPIGGHQKEHERVFTKYQLNIEAPFVFYLFSDGFQDQFGGKDGRKFMSKKFKQFLLGNHKLPMEEQKTSLQKTLNDWAKGEAQVDDILVMGVKLDQGKGTNTAPSLTS